MRIVLFTFLLMLTYQVKAESIIETQIHDVDLGKKPGDEVLIFLSSGQVATLAYEDTQLVAKLQTAKANSAWFKITLSDSNEIIYLEDIEKSYSFNLDQQSFNKNLNAEFIPSVLSSMDQAKEFFFNTKYNTKDSQCFMRAHVWTYDWRKTKNLYSSKIWIFFTRKFIRKHKFGWWFHVAPYVHVIVDGKVKERVMDRKYFPVRGPVKVKQWTDFFIPEHVDCPVVSKYSDQANFPESGSCFVMKSSMYYYQPVDLEIMETKSMQRSNWVESEIKQSYKEAFDLEL